MGPHETGMLLKDGGHCESDKDAAYRKIDLHQFHIH